MKRTTKILKATLTILGLLFVTAFTVTTKASLADVTTDDKQQKKTVKY